MITLKDHGFKFSRPEANVVFDVSYFINPWREKDIRDEKDPEIRKIKILEFMKSQEGVHKFCAKIRDLILQYDDLFPDENIQIAFCCSAGEYRSPAMVEMVARMLPTNYPIKIIHNPNSKL